MNRGRPKRADSVWERKERRDSGWYDPAMPRATGRHGPAKRPLSRRGERLPTAEKEPAADRAHLSRRAFIAATTAAATVSRLAGAGLGPAFEQEQEMSDPPLHYASLTSVARRIHAGELSSVAVTEAQLARIETLDPQLMAYVTRTADQALAAARRADEEIAAARIRGPLHGVPVAVKDLCFTAGIRTAGGTGALAAHVPDHDATVVTRLKEAGAVLLGKLGTTEGAMVGYHHDFRIPRNPWGADRWPGVSSSGSGVATAAGLCYAALGTDTGGSIRFPSAANGIVGLKPTWGRVSRYGVLDLAPSLDHVGPMARRVADAAAVLGVIAGHDPNDPTSLSDPVPDYLAELEGDVRHLRVGFDETFASTGVAAHLTAAIRAGVEVLTGLGVELVEVKMPAMDELMAWTILAATEAAAAHAATYPSRADAYGDYFRSFLEQGTQTSGVQFAAASQQRAALVGKIRHALRDVDVLVCPSMSQETFRYDPEAAYGGVSADGQTLAGVPLGFFLASSPFTTAFDFSGYPTLSLPCGFSPDGLPLSLQLVGHPLSEAVLCRLGHAFESATEWHQHHPPV